MKKYLYSALIGFIIAIVLIGTIFYFTRGKPDPVTPLAKVTVNPSPEAVKKADKAVEVKHDFTIRQPDKMAAGDKQTIPVAVKVKDVATNTTAEATATAEATKTPEGDINVTLPEVIAMDVPKAPPKQNELGAYYDGDKVVYYKRDLLTVGNKIQAAPWLGAAYNVDEHEFKMAAGLAVKW